MIVIHFHQHHNGNDSVCVVRSRSLDRSSHRLANKACLKKIAYILQKLSHSAGMSGVQSLLNRGNFISFRIPFRSVGSFTSASAIHSCRQPLIHVNSCIHLLLYISQLNAIFIYLTQKCFLHFGFIYNCHRGCIVSSSCLINFMITAWAL